MKINFRCGDCGKNISVDSEHAGKRAKCPKCSSVNRIPLAPEELPNAPPVEKNNQEPAGNAETWTVATAKKKRAGLTRSKLQTAVRQGMMPVPTFVKPDNSSDDWRQTDTLDWLVELAARSESRYCENCGTRVCGTAELLSSTVLDLSSL